MIIIDADKFLAYLIFSKHIDGLTCGEVKEAVEMCKVDVLDKIRAELWMEGLNMANEYCGVWVRYRDIERIIDKYKASPTGAESEE